jgi:DNA invertase Pin-like site-specific DNA recombinase
MNIGYARVSTDDQDLSLQLSALRKAKCRRLFQEKISGARADRPELQRMLDQLREGDTVVVWRLDRLARSTRNLLELCETINAAGAGLRSIGEPWADTTSPAGKMVLTVFGGIAEFERALIRERTGFGRKAAKKRGVKFGRPSKLTTEQAALIVRLSDEGQSAAKIAETFGVHETTIYRCLSAAGGK